MFKHRAYVLIFFILCSLRPQTGAANILRCEAELVERGKQKSYQTTEVIPNVYHLSFEAHRDMVATFLRFQEHYESPEFRDKVFSRSKFKKWYRGKHDGHFTYYGDWAGFNIPSDVLRPFFEGQFHFKTPLETALLNEFRKLYRSGRKFYIIGTRTGDASTVDHEVAHGLYYTRPDYKLKVDEVLATIDLTPLHEWLSKSGYHEAVLNDEAHAYLTTGGAEQILRRKRLFSKGYRVAIAKLQAIYITYSGRVPAGD